MPGPVSGLYSRLWALEVIRRRVPYAYWLFYDAVIIYALIWGGWSRVLAFVCVGIAVFFDVVEFIIKGSESRFLRRLFEGTGAPTVNPIETSDGQNSADR